MARSQRLTEMDIRQLMRLVRECCELGDDPTAWRIHMLQRMCALTGARLAVAAHHHIPWTPEEMEWAGRVQVGFDARANQIWDQVYYQEGNVSDDPMVPGIMALEGHEFTLVRTQLCTAREWYASRVVNEVRLPAGTDDCLMSERLVAPALAMGIWLGRANGERAFGMREQRMVNFFHDELVLAQRAPPLRVKPLGLSPRLQQVLQWLLRGYSEKQVSAELGLSGHTVHQYVKELHQRFEVSSRGELIVKALAAHRAYQPRLS